MNDSVTDHPIEQRIKAELIAEMNVQGYSRSMLAEELGVPKQTLAASLKGDLKGSMLRMDRAASLAETLSMRLDITLSKGPTAELHEELEDLDAERVAVLVAIVRAIKAVPLDVLAAAVSSLKLPAPND